MRAPRSVRSRYLDARAMSTHSTPALALIGDVHGDPTAIVIADRRLPRGVPLLQVGDFGWWPTTQDRWIRIASELQRELFWIRGNHEHYPSMPWLHATEVVTLCPQLHFVPDGVVLSVDGLRIGCVGGASSIDQLERRPGETWFAEEVLDTASERRALAMGAVDLLVTHCPPAWAIAATADPRMPALFRLPADWQDPSAAAVERIHAALGTPPLVCGHMHYRWSHAERRVRILDVDEVLPWPPSTAGTEPVA